MEHVPLECVVTNLFDAFFWNLSAITIGIIFWNLNQVIACPVSVLTFIPPLFLRNVREYKDKSLSNKK